MTELTSEVAPTETIAPTDGQRQALAEVIHYALGLDDYGVANDDERQEVLDIADAVFAAIHIVQPVPTTDKRPWRCADCGDRFATDRTKAHVALVYAPRPA